MGIEIKTFNDIKYLFDKYFIDIDIKNRKAKISVLTSNTLINFYVQLNIFIKKNYSDNVKFHDVRFGLEKLLEWFRNETENILNDNIFSDSPQYNKWKFMVFATGKEVIDLIKNEEIFLTISINNKEIDFKKNEIQDFFETKKFIFEKIDELIEKDKEKSKELSDVKVEFKKLNKEMIKKDRELNKKQLEDFIYKLIELIPMIGHFLIIGHKGFKATKLLTNIISKKDK